MDALLEELLVHIALSLRATVDKTSDIKKQGFSK